MTISNKKEEQEEKTGSKDDRAAAKGVFFGFPLTAIVFSKKFSVNGELDVLYFSYTQRKATLRIFPDWIISVP